MSHIAPSIIEPSIGIHGAQQSTLAQIFQHPLTHNLSLSAVTHLFDAIGSTETAHNGTVILRIGDEHLSMAQPHGKDLDAFDVMEVRHFLHRAGWTLQGRRDELEIAAEAAADMVIVVDHSGARILEVDAHGTDGHALVVTWRATHHLLHDFAHKSKDTDRDESFPSDTRFFETIARAISATGRIILIGHGKGQSDEAGHLRTYLRVHHPDIASRIHSKIVADLPHLSNAQLLQFAQEALA